jgi:hypothetical protein
MHDSFNPGCRKSIKEAAWSENAFVHLVELDFVPGRLVSDEAESDYREMWCGFALAVSPARETGRQIGRARKRVSIVPGGAARVCLSL